MSYYVFWLLFHGKVSILRQQLNADRTWQELSNDTDVSLSNVAALLLIIDLEYDGTCFRTVLILIDPSIHGPVVTEARWCHGEYIYFSDRRYLIIWRPPLNYLAAD